MNTEINVTSFELLTYIKEAYKNSEGYINDYTEEICQCTGFILNKNGQWMILDNNNYYNNRIYIDTIGKLHLSIWVDDNTKIEENIDNISNIPEGNILYTHHIKE